MLHLEIDNMDAYTNKIQSFLNLHRIGEVKEIITKHRNYIDQSININDMEIYIENALKTFKLDIKENKRKLKSAKPD